MSSRFVILENWLSLASFKELSSCNDLRGGGLTGCVISGVGLTATPEQAEEAHRFIRKLLQDRVGIDARDRTPILYGGSVTPENSDLLLSCPNIDGALVGGASLKASSFWALLEAGARVLKSD